MRNKSFPYYNEFSLIFGKDCATRKRVEIAPNFIEELDVDEANKNVYSLDDVNTLASNTMIPCVRKRSNSSDSLASGLHDINMMLGKLIEQQDEQMTMLVRKIGYECYLLKQRGKVDAKLMKMNHVSIRD